MSRIEMMNNMLNVLVCSDNGNFVHDVSVDEAGGASDHRLIKARFSLTWRRWTSITYNYRPLSSMDYDVFEQNIRKSALFTNPAQTADLFTVQLKFTEVHRPISRPNWTNWLF